MKKIIKNQTALKIKVGKILAGLTTLLFVATLPLSACATPTKTEEEVVPPTETTQPNGTLSPFDAYSQKIPNSTRAKIVAIYDALANLTSEEATKLAEESGFISNFTKEESQADFLEALKTEKFNKDFGQEPVTFVLEENLACVQKNPIYISLTEGKYDYKSISYNANDIWGYLNGNLCEETQDKFVYNGLVVDFETTRQFSGEEYLSLGYVYANIGDYVVSVYSYENGKDFCIGFSRLFKISDISFEDYAREYGVDDLSLLGWTDSLLKDSKSQKAETKSPNTEKDIEK